MNYLLFMEVKMPIEKVETEVEIPEGYRFVRFGKPIKGEPVIGKYGDVFIWEDVDSSYSWLILEKIEQQPERNKKLKHKHADLICAWAEGAIIQFKLLDGAWEDCLNNSPTWDVGTDYRIKPAVKKVKFRNYLTKSGDIATWVSRKNGVPIEVIESHRNFKCWIGGQQSIEVRC